MDGIPHTSSDPARSRACPSGLSAHHHDSGSRHTWVRPRLVVLARSGAEERVLSGCKGNSVPSSFLDHFEGCHANTPSCTTLCSEQTIS